MNTLRIAILGFGNSGRALARIVINKHREVMEKRGCEFKVIAVATSSRGCLVDEDGIDLSKALKEIEEDGSFDRNGKGYSSFTSMDIVKMVDYDVLIEITPLNIFTGQPAIDHIRGALERKKHVITANKGPVAWAYRELKELASRNDAVFLHETTVMDGTPVFNLVEDTLPLCRINEIRGILNTTTNFILDEMSAGRDYGEAVAEGKKRGFVEADPSLDIEGWDAAAKLTALMNVLMDAGISPRNINRKGIEDVSYDDIKNALKDNKVIKLICRGYIEEGEAFGEVKPILMDKNCIYANITGTSSVISLKTDLMGEITIVEHDPEIEQTGYGIFSDLIRLTKKNQNHG